jgi:hypothetical protein
LAEAHSKFRDRPEIYQEDFMFMGGKSEVDPNVQTTRPGFFVMVSPPRGSLGARLG